MEQSWLSYCIFLFDIFPSPHHLESTKCLSFAFQARLEPAVTCLASLCSGHPAFLHDTCDYMAAVAWIQEGSCASLLTPRPESPFPTPFWLVDL